MVLCMHIFWIKPGNKGAEGIKGWSSGWREGGTEDGNIKPSVRGMERTGELWHSKADLWLFLHWWKPIGLGHGQSTCRLPLLCQTFSRILDYRASLYQQHQFIKLKTLAKFLHLIECATKGWKPTLSTTFPGGQKIGNEQDIIQCYKW